MKKTILVILALTAAINTLSSQEKHGKALNLGFGAGYYGFYNGYYRSASPTVNLNYEFDIGRNLTLGPFVSCSSYRSYRYWGSPDYPYRNYYYRNTIVPVGGKICYYFDELFRAGERWDFYIGTSAGFVIRNTTWENGYYGETNTYANSAPAFVDMHIGSELHLTEKLGLFLDLSTGQSTFGLGFHF